MKKKTYTLKPTKKQLALMNFYWAMFRREENKFYEKIADLEKKLQADTKIRDIEFIQFDNFFIGIGNASRTMKLYQQEDLEK